MHKTADFTELFSGIRRIRVVEPVSTGIRLKDGAKVAEALVFSREFGYHGTVNVEDIGPDFVSVCRFAVVLVANEKYVA